ncbi:MAG TPA: hypothetical protein H9888_04090 [Candidatus Rikenella faecigallinarum]|uniref:Uncharacterized protein n=1 Tax=Candidatus Rikenella faecigallinarum TaxID=2838745 RepID=A0A9D1QEC5_9BACT|nr:hypothetical protein [Candidatus Rikenella faecigallinarum]
MAGMLSLAFTGCEESTDQKTFIYTIGMEDYQYTGSSLLGPISYLSSLNLSEGFTVTADNLTEANAEAITRFNTEMAKIEKAQLDAYGGTYYISYDLYSVSDAKAIATKEFSSSQQ